MSAIARVTVALLVGILASFVAAGTTQGQPLADSTCGLPTTRPLWIDYGEGSVPQAVRDVFGRPGVVVAASGTALPKLYRQKGARTVFFVLNLPRLIGEPGEPADPSTIPAMVDQTYERAVASTECATPIIGLNELLGPAAPVPWTANVAQYRANVLALVRGLAAKGARPALLIHGNPGLTGEAEQWWRDVSRSADIVYESYYNAPAIMRLGRIVGTRRIRMGMRAVAERWVAIGVPRQRLGFVLGFQVALGAAGREGLEPTSAWLRYVKWNALAARQVVTEIGASTIWSWGWANFGPQSVDPDKAAAAGVYLWSRDPSLYDGPAVAGPNFNSSRVEGTIALPDDTVAVSASGKIAAGDLSRLTRVMKRSDVAFTGLFSRLALRPRIPVSKAEVMAYEQAVVAQAFEGSRPAYLEALARHGATLQIARGAIVDVLTRQKISALVSRGALGASRSSTVLEWVADNTSAEVDTATSLRDVMPGSGDFPASNSRDVPNAPILMRLPFLGADDSAPASPKNLRVKQGDSIATLTWGSGSERDLIGYVVFRKNGANGTFKRLTPLWLTHPTYVDRTVTGDSTPIYVVRAVDLSGNVSVASTEQA